MNTTIMAERQAKALAAIREHTERLGGRLEMPTGPAPNPQVKFTLLLEAVAKALEAIELPEFDLTIEEPDGRQTVIHAAADEPKAAPKGKRGSPAPDPDSWMKSGRGKEA